MKIVKFKDDNNVIDAILLRRDGEDALLLLPPKDKYEIPCMGQVRRCNDK